jgi:transcriptional regulator with XRE-family HTH domain
MNPAPMFPVRCAAPFARLVMAWPSACEAPHPSERWGPPEFLDGCDPLGPEPPGSTRATCGFWPASTAATEWWIPPQLSLPGVHPIGADELSGLREVYPSVADPSPEVRDVHASAYEALGSSLVAGPGVHETDPRLDTGHNFGRHVRSLRRARGMTQEVLADRSALSADTIRRLEHGSFSPSLDTLRKLCVGLDLMMSTLFESFELGARDEARELLDLLATRTPRELVLATRVLRTLFDELDDMRGLVTPSLFDEEDDEPEGPTDEDTARVVEEPEVE